MSLSSNNLDALYDRHPHLKVKEFQPGENAMEILETASGYPTARVNNTFIHSKYNPHREAQRLITAEDATVAVFYGFGLGYLVEAYQALHPDRPLVVVEPNIGLFAQALAARDYRPLFKAASICWFIDEDAEKVVAALQEFPVARVQIIRLRSVFFLNQKYYQNLDHLIQAFLSQKEINVNTLKRFGKLWVSNLLQNLEHFSAAPGVQQLSHRFDCLPALILAAGPSLDQVLPYLKALQRRMLIVAVDTSLEPALRMGVHPDFVVTVDPQYWNSRHLDRTVPRHTILVSEAAANPHVFRRLAGLSLFFMSSFFPLGQLLEQAIGEKGRVGAGGSVTTTAWDFAYRIGADPIYIAGLDLGFPNNRTHVRGAFFEERMFVLANRFAPVELMTYRYVQQADPFPMRSNSDHAVLTDRRMIIYKWWFENQLKSRPETTYTLSESGLLIEGMPYRSVEQLQSLPEIRDRLEGALKAIGGHVKEFHRGSQERLERGLRSLADIRNQLAVLHRTAQKGLEICSTVHIDSEHWQSALGRLNAVDTSILELSSRKIAGFLLQPLIQKIVNNPQKKSLEEVLKTSTDMYREICESAGYHLDLIDKRLAISDEKR